MARPRVAYWKKVLAGFLSAATGLMGPGWSGYASLADDRKGSAPVYDRLSGRIVDPQVAKVVDLLRSDPNLLTQLDPAMRQRAIDYMRRLDKETTSDAELVGQLQQLSGALKNPDGKDPAAILMDFFANTANRAVDFERGRITQSVIPLGDTGRRVIVKNTATGQLMQDIVVQRVEHGFQRFTVKQPDPATGNLQVEQLGYTFNDHGKDTQKIAFSRSFNKMVRMVIKIFYERHDLQDLINDSKTSPEAKQKLRDQLAEIQKNFPADILAFRDDMKKDEDSIDAGNSDWSRPDLETKAARLANMQQRVLGYYNNNQLETLQKTLMAQFVYYFTSIAGLSYNPFDKKDDTGVDITRMKTEDVQKILDSFQKGDYQGSGFMPWSDSMAALNPQRDLANDPDYDKLDAADKDPKRRAALYRNALTLQSISLQAIQYLGFATDAQKRLFDPNRLKDATFKSDLTQQEKAAAMGEMDRWVRLAQLNIQRFQVQSMAIQMWRLKNKKLKGEMGLHWDDPGMRDRAQALIDQAEDEVLPRMKQLEEQSRASLVDETASAIKNSMLHARYDAHELEGIAENIKEMIAQARQLRALYLADQFNIFAYSDEVLARYSTSQQVQGQLYKDFMDHLPPEVKSALKLHDEVEADLQALLKTGGLDVSAIKEKLGPIAEKIGKLLELLKLKEVPSAETQKKRQDKLKVFQANLNGIISTFSSKLQVFDMVNELNLYMEEMASSKSTDNSHLGSFKSLDNVMNTGGGRDWAGEKGAKLWNRKAWQVLKENEPKRLEAMEDIRKGDFNAALKLLGDLDPDAKKEALDKMNRDKPDAESAFDIISLLTRGMTNDDAALAQASLTSAFGLMPSYIKGFTAGTIAYDTVVMSILTFGFGGLIAKALGGAAKAFEAGADALKVMRASAVFEQLGIIGKAIQALLWVAEKFMALGGWLLGNMALSIRTNLGLPTEAAEAGMKSVTKVGLAQIARNSIMFQIKTTATMAVAGAMMSASMHAITEWRHPGTSSYKSTTDAMAQGALSGASFGAKTTWLMLASPLSTASLGKTGFQGWYRSLGEVAGPLDWTSRKLAAVFTTGGAGSVAEDGLWRVAGQSAELIRAGSMFTAAGAYKALLKTVLFGGGFIDGGLKFFGLAELTKQGVRDVHYAAHAMFGGAKADFASSGHAAQFMESTSAGERASQISWLLLPMSPHGDAENRKEQMESLRGINTLDMKGREALLATMNPEVQSKGEMQVERPWSLLRPMDMIKYGLGTIREYFGGKAAERPMDTIKLSAFTSAEVVRRLSMDGRADKFTNAEILTIYSATEKYMNKMLDIGETSDALLNPAKGIKGPGVDAAAGVQALDVQKSAAEQPSDEAIRKQYYEMIIMPTMREIAENALRTRLQKDPGLVNDLYQEFKDPKTAKEGITFSGQRITNENVIRDLKNIVGWTLIERETKLGPGFGERMKEFTSDGKIKSNAERITDRMATELQLHIQEAEANGRTLSGPEIEEFNKNSLKKVLDSIGTNPEREATRWAVELHGRSFKGEALDRYSETIVADFMNGKYGEKGSPAAEAAINRQVEISNLALKTHEIVDAKGRSIDTYKPIQIELFKTYLDVLDEKGGDAKESLKAFLMAHTGAGKSLLGMVLLMPIIRGVVKQANLDGVDYNTHGELLRAQAQAVYSAYFHGKKPDFRIQTLSDLAGEHLTAKATRGESPLDRRFQIFDEFDALFLDPPTSLGKAQGSIKDTSPLYKALAESHKEVSEAVEELGLKGSDITVQELNERLESGKDPALNERFNALQDNLHKALKDAMVDARDGGGRDAKDAKKFADVVGVSLRFGFNMEGFARYTIKDFIREQAVLDPTREAMKSPIKKGKPILLHGGIQAYTDLDAPGRMGKEIEDGADIQLPFQNLEMTNAADVLRSTRYMVALSGTLPEALRPILEEANVVIAGHGTRTADGRYFVATGDESPIVKMAEMVRSDVNGGDKKLAVVVVNTVGELSMVDDILTGKVKVVDGQIVRDAKGQPVAGDGVGLAADEIVRYRVGDTFKAEKLFQAADVAREQNLGAMEIDKTTGKAKAKVVLLTVGASRGLDMTLDGYDNVNMYGVDPQKMALVNFTQGQGRIDFDRLVQGAKRKFFYFTHEETLSSDKEFQRVARRLAERALAGPEGEDPLIEKVAGAVRETWSDPAKRPENFEGDMERMSDRDLVKAFFEQVQAGYEKELIDVRLEKLVRQAYGKKNIPADEKAALQEQYTEQATNEVKELLAGMSLEERVQRGLEEPSVLSNADDPKAALDALNSARDLVVSRRIRETFQAELESVRDDPEAAKKFVEKVLATGDLIENGGMQRIRDQFAEADPNFEKNAVFFEYVLRQAQRQAENQALSSSGITQIEQRFKPGELQSLAVMTIGVVAGGVAAGLLSTLTMSSLLPLNGFLSFLQHPIVQNPLMLAVMWLTMKTLVTKVYAPKPKPYSTAGGAQKGPTGTVVKPPPPSDDEADGVNPVIPPVTNGTDPNLVPPTPTIPK